MTRPNPKTVKAWGFAVRCASGATFVQTGGLNGGRTESRGLKALHTACGDTCGPVVRIEVPAPKERKR